MNRIIAIIGLCFFGVLFGCALHEPQSQKVTSFADSYMQSSAVIAEGRVTTHRWWEMYGDSKLNELMARGFAGNLDLEIAWARLQQARALEAVAGASQFPDINGTGGTGRSQSTPSLSSYQNHQLSVAASYELDVWHKLAN